jgi:hypothetical protein
MAQVIADTQTVVVKPWWARVRIVFIGAGLGLLWWVLTALLRFYIIEPLACRDLASANACVGSLGIAGSIVTVLVAILGTFLLVKTLQPRPLVISVSAAAVLWSLGAYVEGLAWFEAIIWGIVLYAVTYVLFGVIANISRLPVVIGVAIGTALIIRLLLLL